MSKHRSEIYTGGQLFDQMSEHNAATWWEVVNWHAPGLDMEDEATEKAEREKALACFWVVGWPDHVVNPRLNDDAYYKSFGSLKEAEAELSQYKARASSLEGKP